MSRISKIALAIGCLSLIQSYAFCQDGVDPDVIAQVPAVQYVTMPPVPATPLYIALKVEGASDYGGELEGIASGLSKFWNEMGRHRINVVGRAYTPITGGIIGVQHKLIEFKPGAHSHVPIIGNGVSGKHESGHEFRLGHSHTRIWSTQTKIGYYKNESDPYDPMTTLPGVQSLNPPHLYFLKYFTTTEEAYAQDGGQYTLSIFFNKKHIEYTSLKTLFYAVPGTTRKYWFSYHGPDLATAKVNPVLVVHSQDPGSPGTTYYEGNIAPGVTHLRTGLIFTYSNATATSIKVGVTVDPTWVPIGN